MITDAAEQNSIPRAVYNFCKIPEIAEQPQDTIVDVIGIITTISEIQSIKTKTGTTAQKRTITMIDDTKTAIDISVWGASAEKVDDSYIQRVICLKAARVSDFAGKTLNTQTSTQLEIDPDIPECYALQRWMQTLDNESVTITHIKTKFPNTFSHGDGAGASAFPSDPKTIQQVKDENLGAGDSAYFTLKGVISLIKKSPNPWYVACPTCRKKVTPETGRNQWHCETCSASHVEPQYRYLLQFNLRDSTSSLWLSAFHDVAQKILLGREAKELNNLKEQGNDPGYEAVFDEACLTRWSVRCRAKEEEYEGIPRKKYSVVSADPIDYAVESRNLLANIQALSL
eukprot:TRINITY_DN3740_c0_g1_i1.p1 TRINITY_DN3740_c0_g1~~TRINITY_DN3740_c0_g1_i1.p1  ORF type:complete len:342 (-),score=122.19 TRINITY_DN3740_c0_g1_i1:6-1031(-)